MHNLEDKKGEASLDSDDRRDFLTTISSLAMTAGLAGSYGAFALIAGRFLYPAGPPNKSWQYVTRAKDLPVGASILYRAPSGETVGVTRQGDTGTASDFVALSSTCPHLGCQVHWESQNERYFCPCHNGTFDGSGKGTGGPPGDAGQSLLRYPLKIENGLLFIEAPVDRLADRHSSGEVLEESSGISAPGHDPCLAKTPRLA